MNIGFIGLGNMGFGIATRLLNAGHHLTVYDIKKAVTEPLLKSGAVWADTPRAIAEVSEIVFTSLPGPKDVEAVALGPNGIWEGITPDGVFIDLSTNYPEVVRRLYDRFKEKKAHVMDVPIGDGADEVMSGQLMLMASGDEEIFQKCKPVLETIGNKVRYMGKIGNGTICKIVHNCMSLGIQTVVAEGFSLGLKAGIGPEDIWWVISQAAVGKGALFHILMPRVYLPRDFDPPHFALSLAFKDVSLAAALGREYNVPMLLTNLTVQEFMSAMNRGWGNKDAVMAMVLQEERAGIGAPDPESNKI